MVYLIIEDGDCSLSVFVVASFTQLTEIMFPFTSVQRLL